MARSSLALTALLAVGLLLASAPAQAIYILRPLDMEASATEADVGDEVTFTISPNDRDYEGPSYADRTVTIRYVFDPEEGTRETASSENGDHPVSSDETRADDEADTVSRDNSDNGGDQTWEDPRVFRDIQQITLDAGSRATFTWTIPAEVDDRNVFVEAIADDGSVLASVHLAIGDAEPMAFLAMEGVQRDLAEDTSTNSDADARDTGDAASDERNETPALGLLGLGLAVAAGAAFAARRREG